MKNESDAGKLIRYSGLIGFMLIGALLIDVLVIGDSIGYAVCCGLPALLVTIVLNELIFSKKDK